MTKYFAGNSDRYNGHVMFTTVDEAYNYGYENSYGYVWEYEDGCASMIKPVVCYIVQVDGEDKASFKTREGAVEYATSEYTPSYSVDIACVNVGDGYCYDVISVC